MMNFTKEELEYLIEACNSMREKILESSKEKYPKDSGLNEILNRSENLYNSLIMRFKSEKAKLIIFSAPSGSGKSTIIGRLHDLSPNNYAYSISATSREPRGQEKDGVDYHFLSQEEFIKKIKAGDFLEYEEVYDGILYGTLKEDVDNLLSEGKDIMFDLDVKGALNIKNIYGDKAILIFIKPPSLEELERRLRLRGEDSEEMIQRRLGKAEEELSYASQFDHIVINDDLEETMKKIYDIVL